MHKWKTLVFVILALTGVQAAAENKGSYQNSMMITLAPTLLLSGTTGLSELAVKQFQPAKADALAFVGSNGEIRGAQFEQAVRYYHSAYGQPYMTDEQLALVIATTL
ncbi:DUF2388 domain-containing protein [Pseudomonas protegens]|uniref:DUF2388 domain-containing protein n=1 Tax=Pseudomonas protegens TaxID=380021 RepID=UPI0039068785